MTEILTASTQYSDLVGTIALDGYSGSFLRPLASQAVPAGYVPVGLELWTQEPGTPGTGSASMSVTLFAVEASVVGADPDAIRAFAAKNQTVPVRRFEVALPFTEVVALMKRCHIVVADRHLLGETPMFPQDNR